MSDWGRVARPGSAPCVGALLESYQAGVAVTPAERVKMPSMAALIPVVFIASRSFSGSTLLSLLMGAHAEVATVGELTGLLRPQYPCSCGAAIVDCPMWKRVTAAMNRRGQPFDLCNFDLSFDRGKNILSQRLLSRPLHSRLADAARDRILQRWPRHTTHLARIGDRNRAMIESLLEVTGKSAFVDASKDPMRILHLARTPGISLRVIHLVRDARASVNSTRKNIGHSAAAAALQWRLAHHSIELNLKRTGVPAMRMRYEDLCADPLPVLNEAFELCGAPPLIDVPDYRAVEHHILGNRMRLASSSRITVDESWKAELNDATLRIVDRIAGRVNRGYGYA